MICALTIQNLALRRGGRLLFQGLDLSLRAGEAAALTGRNGAGKTSLLRAVAGFVGPETGSIGFGDLDPSQARSDHIHLAGHQDGQKPARTVREELDFWTLWTGGARASANAAVEALDLRLLLELEVRRLSAGQRRRLAFARLLAAPRGLWLLDEPLSPLDAEWRARFAAMMDEHLAKGGMIVAAVHDPLPVDAKIVEIAA